MKFLGIDFGTKRIGLATSDDGGTMAFPLEVVANDARIFERLSEVIEKNKVETVVIGLSLDYKRKENAVTEKILAFKEDLAKIFSGVIHLEDESLSSKQARSIQKDKEGLDARAAAIILQSYLDRRAHKQKE